MEFIADLHIHSHFSRATSKMLAPEFLDYQAGLKGVRVIGTGDFTHPGWLKELKEKLDPDGNGLFRLKKPFRKKPFLSDNDTRFLLTAEISSIFKRDNQVRKIHNLIFAPGFEAVEKINARLLNAGANLSSDGRPILGMDCRDLLELVLESDVSNFFVPAHIWTPWFSMLGSKSGFNSPRECFGDLAPFIYAVETGLSTDAPMNWLCSFLDRFTLISNSDAHSPDRLGRNANIFNCEPGYFAITEALKTGNPAQFGGTIDLFPQEGKYHFDGHRKCGICWNPVDTLRNNGICPKCKKPVTIGVMNRIIRLSDRTDVTDRPGRLPFYSIIPLRELIGEILQTGENSIQADQSYLQTIRKLGPELDILLKTPLEDIKKAAGEKLFEAIRRMREREVIIEEGYDGEYGRIKVFRDGEAKNFSLENKLFQVSNSSPKLTGIGLINFNISDLQNLIKPCLTDESPEIAEEQETVYNITNASGCDPDQESAIRFVNGPSLVLAGPGTGKTKTLTDKIASVIASGNAEPSSILAITFTNKAASEMRQRLFILLNDNELANRVTVTTFHAFGWEILKNNPELLGRTKNCSLIDKEISQRILKKIAGPHSEKAGSKISDYKNGIGGKEIPEFFNDYEKTIAELNVFDLDDLISKPLILFSEDPGLLQSVQHRYRFLFVDEFQDTNPVQYQLIRTLMPDPLSNLCVVGDPNQSVYSFRGASSEIFSWFLVNYPATETFLLRTSYRCPQSILKASSSMLNPEKDPLRGLSEGIRITLSEQATDKSEAEFIAREIVKLMGGVSFFSIDSAVTDGYSESLSGIAVLCRTKNQFPVLVKAFNDHLIPYQVVGDEPFYSDEPFRTLINLLHALELSGTEKLPLFLKLNDLKFFPSEFEDLKDSVSRENPADVCKAVATRFLTGIRLDEPGIRRFLQLAGGYASLPDFLTSLRMGTGRDAMENSADKVLLMTLHASKGLEFNCVFIPGCEQGLIPYTLYRQQADQEEEKRLFYVGMTRVKRILYLSHAKQRILRNRKFALPVSEFISSIEDELLNRTNSYKVVKTEKGNEQLSLF